MHGWTDFGSGTTSRGHVLPPALGFPDRNGRIRRALAHACYRRRNQCSASSRTWMSARATSAPSAGSRSRSPGFAGGPGSGSCPGSARAFPLKASSQAVERPPGQADGFHQAINPGGGEAASLGDGAAASDQTLAGFLLWRMAAGVGTGRNPIAVGAQNRWTV